MRDRVLQKEEKRQKKNGVKENDKKEDGIIRDEKGEICCCIPFIQCMKKGTPLPTTIEDGVKLCCTNECIFSKNPVHIECFESLEQNLITMLNHQRTCKKGVIKAWLDSQNEVNLWSKTGLGFIQKTIRCPCGKGQMYRDEEAWIKREKLVLPLKDKKDKKFKLKTNLPALQVTVKKGAAPPPGFHDLDNHYLSSKSPPPTDKLVEDKYGSPPPETKAKKVRHTSTTSNEATVSSPKPANVFRFDSIKVKPAPKPEPIKILPTKSEPPSKKMPIGWSPIEPKIAKTPEEPKTFEIPKTIAEQPKMSEDVQSPEIVQPKINPLSMDMKALLESCEVNLHEEDSSSEEEEDSEDHNNEMNTSNEISPTNTTTSETSSLHSYQSTNRVSMSVQTEETSFPQSAYGSQRLYNANLSYTWNPMEDSSNNERFGDYSLRRFTDDSSARKASNASSAFNHPYYKQEEKLFSSPKVIFLFRYDETFAVEVDQNGRREKLKNASGNEWTPMYLSLTEGRAVIGENAKSEFYKYPNCVAYDILKVIGKPLNEIYQMYPPPKNNLVMADDKNCFAIETLFAGKKYIPEETIMAGFLKVMKEQAEKYLNTDIKSVLLSTNFKLSEFQRAVFLKAASKLNFEILSFALNDY